MKSTILFLIVFLAACTTAVDTGNLEKDNPVREPDQREDGARGWLNIELTDVNSGETYTIGQFDEPVFVESFAVWCPTCTRQQKEFKKFHETNDNFVSVALDTDPNENAAAIKEHAEANGFTWRYSVSPAELTQGLIDDFGLGVVNAPAVPVVLICPDKSTHFLGRGVKDQADLDAAIASCEAA